MGSMFRSEEMTLCQLFLQPEAAYTTVAALGEAGIFQFRDLNPEVNMFQRTYVADVRRGEEMERQLQYVTSQVKMEGIPIPENMPNPSAPNPREIVELESILEKAENEIQEVSRNTQKLKTTLLEFIEVENILSKTNIFFEEQENGEVNRAFVQDEAGTVPLSGDLQHITGVVQRESVPTFERMLWRVSKGNVFFRKVDVEEPLKDPRTGADLYKSVFVVFFQGDQLKTRIKKVCTGYHAKTYDCPVSNSERRAMYQDIKARLQDLTLVMNQAAEHRHRLLVAFAKELFSWKVKISKMKAVFHTMNCFNVDVSKKCLIGEGWVPTNDLEVVQRALTEGSLAVGSSIPSFLNIIHTLEEPPTYNRSNKFTKAFQILIDAYGVSSYREVNPALYTIITFPFLFGVMFGDMGHGLILVIFAAICIIREQTFMAQKSKNEIWNIFFGGRYIILLMGIFSMYTGFVYNDIFSKSFNIFGSSWKINYDMGALKEQSLTLDPATKDYLQYPYPIGVDPAWQLADNKIVFLNNYKMKLSIIFGVIHMIFGVFLSIPNYTHFRKTINILTQFLPQLLFIVCIFFYLAVMILIKWILYPSGTHDVLRSTTCAPPVLILFIKMVMFQEPDVKYKECKTAYMYDNQQLAQMILMVIALLCIPWLLIANPVYQLCCKTRKHTQTPMIQDVETSYEDLEGTSHDTVNTHGHEEKEEEDEPASEIIIHQIIHTIETVLSTVSHTASYLRLWALSLAHAQLSDVLWGKVLNISLSMDLGFAGCILIYVIFAIWAFLTIAILIMMEGLSAFLHTLRLHWVEFMSKFFSGLGYQFQPFSFKVLLDAEEALED